MSSLEDLRNVTRFCNKDDEEFVDVENFEEELECVDQHEDTISCMQANVMCFLSRAQIISDSATVPTI